ncbi:ig-like domain-containing protein [Trichonephila clavipes]|nr:ig-like domain-containing protein [Trichonephila clavipes]
MPTMSYSSITDDNPVLFYAPSTLSGFVTLFGPPLRCLSWLLVLAACLNSEPHRVAITPPELRLEVGKTATLNCSVFGNPSGSVVWRKDMMTLLPSPRIIFPNPYLLQVRQIRRQDAGMYQCFVQRELYSSQAAARIIIGGIL